MERMRKESHEVARGRSARTPLWIFAGVWAVVWGVAAVIATALLLVWFLA